MSEENKINYPERRKRFMETFKGDPVLTETLPKLAAQLFYDEFGASIADPAAIPVVWTTAWQHIMNFVHAQESEQFAISICGFTLQYVTEFSESDKARNIVPELYHEYIPIFRKKDHNVVPGCEYNAELSAKYNDWRTVNLTETIDKVERDVFEECSTKWGLHLMIAATIFPLVAAIYSAGVHIALETGKPVNMYNWFTITPRNNDKIILTPLASIKQGLKDDNKRGAITGY